MIKFLSAIRMSIVAFATFAIVISGCTLPGSRSTSQCNCNQTIHQTSVDDCACNARHSRFSRRWRGFRLAQRPVIDANPYNLPQNLAPQSPAVSNVASTSPQTGCGCANTPIIINDPSNQAPSSLPLEDSEPQEFESVPEATSSEPLPKQASSRMTRQDPSVAETISQMLPPVAESPEDFQQAIVATPAPTKEVTVLSAPPVQSETNVDAVVEEEIVEVAKAPAISPPKEKRLPYYEPQAEFKKLLAGEEKGHIEIDEAQQFKPRMQSNPNAGAAFDELANEIFQNINIEEELLTPPAIKTPVPARPASIEIESQPQPVVPQADEEVFGAIQFDAYLQRVTAGGVYARQDELKPRKVSNFTPKAKLDAEDVDFMIRPLPEVTKREIVAEPNAPKPYEFQSMPTYHMPTLRAIPQTIERETVGSTFKIHVPGAPSQVASQPRPAQSRPIKRRPLIETNNAPMIIRSIPFSNPTNHSWTDSNLGEEQHTFEPLPIESKPLITPLPSLPSDQIIQPLESEKDSQASRRLTQKPAKDNPLR